MYNMKKVILVSLVFFFMLTLVYAAEACDVEVSILNQDPFPAVPGDSVEIVFMLSGIDSGECGEVVFEVLNEYPFSVLPSSESLYKIQSGTYTKDYSSHKTIPVDFKVDQNALNGENPLEIRYKISGQDAYLSKKFDISIEDVRADFEIFVSDYSYTTKEIKFEVLNIGESDIEAVTIEIPKQEGIKVYGANRENIGDLSSNEDTSADFKIDVTKDTIDLNILYSDSIQVRRTANKEIVFDENLFELSETEESTPTWYWIVLVLVIVVIIYFYRKRKKKKK